jgi:O-antigen/teichoic acid export membrane protein
MKLKENITANYASQIYVTIVNFMVMPFYIKNLGAEAFGLVGFFGALQAWFSLLDIGLQSSLSRESVRYYSGAISEIEFRQIFRVLSLIFYIVALLGGGVLFFTSDLVAAKWLNGEVLLLEDIKYSVQAMALIVALRWLGGLYRSIIVGAEKMVNLAIFNIGIATIRFILVIPIMWFYGFTPRVFFTHQFFVAVFEFFYLYFMGYALLPRWRSMKLKIGWQFGLVRPMIKFSLTIAFTSALWILVTQIDKLILSGILTISNYGYFNVAVMLAGSINIITGPVTSAILPRLAGLEAGEKHAELIELYRDATKWVVAIAGSIVLMLSFYPESFVFSWTGSTNVTEYASPIVRLYALGNGLVAICAFPYYLQYAKGNLKYHLSGNIIFNIVLIPLMAFSAINYGAVGSGLAWVIANCLVLVLWVPYVHNKIEPNLHWRWITDDVLKILAPGIFVALLLFTINHGVLTRVEHFIKLILFGSIIFGVMVFINPTLKRTAIKLVA